MPVTIRGIYRELAVDRLYPTDRSSLRSPGNPHAARGGCRPRAYRPGRKQARLRAGRTVATDASQVLAGRDETAFCVPVIRIQNRRRVARRAAIQRCYGMKRSP